MRDTKGIVNVWTRLKFCIIKERANGCNIVGQQLQTLLDQKCYILRPFAHPVACCCVLLGVVAQSLKPPVKLLTPCKGTQHCWELLRPFSRTIVALIVRIGSFTVRTVVKVNSQSLIWSRVSWNKSQQLSLIIFLALQTLKKKNKKRFSERENKAWPFFLIFRWHKSWAWKWWPNSFYNK